MRATELLPNCSTKITILIAILLGACCSYETVGPINYAWLNSPTLIFSLDIIEAQFRWGWKRELFVLVCISVFSESSVHWDVILLFLIDICVILFVNVHPVFILNGRLTLITLKETTPPLWILEEDLSVLFYATSFLVWKSVLVILHWDCYQLTGLISNFCREFMKISQSPSHFVFSLLTRKKVFRNLLSQSCERKKLTNQTSRRAHSKHYMLWLYYYVFLMPSYIFKMFLFSMFGKSTIALLEWSIWFEAAMSLKSLCRHCEQKL